MSRWAADGRTAFEIAEPRIDLAEWRWEAYTDHLADLGYDLAGGTVGEDVLAATPDGYIARHRAEA